MEKFLSTVKPLSQLDYHVVVALRSFNDINFSLNLLSDLSKHLAASSDYSSLVTMSSSLDSFICKLKTDLQDAIEIEKKQAEEFESSAEE